MDNSQALAEIKRFLDTEEKIVIMCIGNVLCGDDAAGMKLAEKISAEGLNDNITVFACSSAPENFTGAVKDCEPQKILMIDAAFMGKVPGTIGIIDPSDTSGYSFSTHMLPLKYIVDYFKASLCCSIMLAGIEPGDCVPGNRMCEQAERAVQELSDLLLKCKKNVTINS